MHKPASRSGGQNGTNPSHGDASRGQYSVEMIMKQSQVIMRSICPPPPPSFRQERPHIADTSPFALNMYECKLSASEFRPHFVESSNHIGRNMTPWMMCVKMRAATGVQ